MHINLTLTHFWKDYSLASIQLGVPAIFSPIFSSTLNFCWRQKGSCFSAGCCSLLVLAGTSSQNLRLPSVFGSCRIPRLSVSGAVGRGQSNPEPTSDLCQGWPGSPPCQPAPKCSPGAHSCICRRSHPGSWWVDGGTRATGELEASGEGPSFSLY